MEYRKRFLRNTDNGLRSVYAAIGWGADGLQACGCNVRVASMIYMASQGACGHTLVAKGK